MDVDGSWQEPPIGEVYIVILLRLTFLPPAKSQARYCFQPLGHEMSINHTKPKLKTMPQPSSLQGVSSEERETLWKAPSWKGCWLSP